MDELPESIIEKEEEIFSEETKENLKNKISLALKNKYALTFILIFILGIIIRIYFFSITKSQPLWWDEADYMAFAKNLAGIGNVEWIVTPKHNSFLPFIAAALMKISTSEVFLRFVLEFLPSVILIFLTYKVLSLMYQNRKVALISSFLMVVLWNVLFNSFRFHLDIPALMFAFLAIYVFWQGYERREKIFGKINPRYAIPLAVFFTMIVYAIRKPYFLFGIFLIVYMLSTRNFESLIKDKYNWYGLLLAVILIFIIHNFIFVSALGASETVSDAFGENFDTIPLKIFGVFFDYTGNLNWHFLTLLPSFTLNVLTLLFKLGFIILLLNFFLSLKHLRKNANLQARADFFHLISIIITLIFFFFLTRKGNLGDPRWYYPLLLASFVAISKGALLIYGFIKKYNKPFAIIFIALLLGFAGYAQFKQADATIKNKAETYIGVKDASLYLNENSNLEDIIISQPITQTAFYSERVVWTAADLVGKDHSADVTRDEFMAAVEANKNVKYLVVSFSEPGHPNWMRKESEEYGIDPNTGQVRLMKLEIPFMGSKFDFRTNFEFVNEKQTYGNLTFIQIYNNPAAFVFRIDRAESEITTE